MIDVRQGGPGEVEVRLWEDPGKVTWDSCEEPLLPVVIWFDTSAALDLANKLMDIVQAMDDAEREREP